MTIFIGSTTPQQPAFIYASYPVDATATASSAATGHAALNVLQADESEGWKPATVSGSHTLTTSNDQTVDVVALQGKRLDGATFKVEAASTPEGARTELLAPVVIPSEETVWFQIASTTLPYLIYTFSGVRSEFQVKHIAATLLVPLPFLEDGVCTSPLQAEGEHLVSQAGLYLGSVTTKVTRPFSLRWGDVDPIEEVPFADMATSCVATAQGLFFVPDIGQSQVHFGVIDRRWKYEPKMRLGLYQIPAIPFTSRA